MGTRRLGGATKAGRCVGRRPLGSPSGRLGLDCRSLGVRAVRPNGALHPLRFGSLTWVGERGSRRLHVKGLLAPVEVEWTNHRFVAV
jgi:hypothetical protein